MRQAQEMLNTFEAQMRQAQGMLKMYGPQIRQAQEMLKTFEPQVRQAQEMQNLVRRYSTNFQFKKLPRQFEPYIQLQNMLSDLQLPRNTQGMIDLSQFEISEEEERETKQVTETVTQAASQQESLQAVIEIIVNEIFTQQKPTVQFLLWLYFSKLIELLISGAIAAAMAHYAPSVLSESPQAAKKEVQEKARAAVGSPELLMEYRYVSTKVLIVRQNPRASSPEIGRLSFGKPVKLQKKEKDFALVLWTDEESGAEIQGWVFSRYLGKFN